MSANAAALTAARFDKRRIPAPPEPPADVRSAYLDQATVVRAWLERLGGEPVGYKVACTNEIAQKHLGTDGPFFGRILSATTWDSPVTVDAEPYFMRVIEPEFGFQMGADLPPRDTPYSRDEVAAAASLLLPAIEIVDSRYDQWTTAGLRALIVDNACHGGWVRGPRTADWRSLDLPNHPVRLFLNGKETASGTGAAVLGHPLNALAWLANRLNEFGSGLRAGDWVSTGVCTDICFANPGDTLSADYGSLGSIELSFR